MWNSRRELQSQWAWLLKIPQDRMDFSRLSVKVFSFPLVFGFIEQLPAGGVVQRSDQRFSSSKFGKNKLPDREEKALLVSTWRGRLQLGFNWNIRHQDICVGA